MSASTLLIILLIALPLVLTVLFVGTYNKLVELRERYKNSFSQIDLKADATIAHVMQELTSTENRIAFARQAFNDHVMQYNTARETFPNIAVAQLLGFGPAQRFHVEDAEAREPVRVSFD